MSCDIDSERRFGGLDRLYGAGALDALRAARATVVGLGGVGSWAAEALARSGIGTLTLIDLDHIAESNINRQVHALGRTLGQSKVEAMADRIRDISPQCVLNLVDDFLDPGNVARLLADEASVVLDCTDQVSAKIAMILHVRRSGAPLVVCGGAGGKTDPLALRAGDLSEAVNDALLAKIRNQLRRQHGYPKASTAAGKPARRVPKMKVRSLWVDQPAQLPAAWSQDVDAPAGAPQGLSCAGYGSAVTVTAAMGLAAAHEVLRVVFPAAR
ncbi:MAG: tRNA threonylcarbamoyladenosine dehydratase [Pigmentiphaga sp.]|uniref:tRNA threonylcarbamoyladenosine dehydratase n=1 Tax=Pigmentiphaga sp. TaxID=1977564 RepID=UPI003B549B39